MDLLTSNLLIASLDSEHPIGPVQIEFTRLIYAGYEHTVKYEEEGNTLSLSKDDGVTFIKELDVSGIDDFIQFCHVFSNDSVCFGTHKKMFYSADWLTFSESNVTDLDGSPFVPVLTYCNFNAGNYTERAIIDGVEILVWGNYENQQNKNSQPGLAYVWYTTDFGSNIKMCYKFGTTIPQNKTTALTARHVHDVNFFPESKGGDNSFWISTGDEPTINASHIIKATYSPAADTFEFTWIGSGNKYKALTINFYNGWLYYAWDIVGGGICRVLPNEFHDTSKIEEVFRIANDATGLIVTDKGEMILRYSGWGGGYDTRFIVYSPDGETFHYIRVPFPDLWDTARAGIRKLRKPTNSGKILGSLVESTTAIRYDVFRGQPSVWLDDVIRNAGFRNAFK